MEKAKDAAIVGILVGTLGLGMYDNKRKFLGILYLIVEMSEFSCSITFYGIKD